MNFKRIRVPVEVAVRWFSPPLHLFSSTSHPDLFLSVFLSVQPPPRCHHRPILCVSLQLHHVEHSARFQRLPTWQDRFQSCFPWRTFPVPNQTGPSSFGSFSLELQPPMCTHIHRVATMQIYVAIAVNQCQKHVATISCRQSPNRSSQKPHCQLATSLRRRQDRN